MGDEEEEPCPLLSLALLGTMKYFPGWIPVKMLYIFPFQISLIK